MKEMENKERAKNSMEKKEVFKPTSIFCSTFFLFLPSNVLIFLFVHAARNYYKCINNNTTVILLLFKKKSNTKKYVQCIGC